MSQSTSIPYRAAISKAQSLPKPLQPMPLRLSVILFGLPALFMFASIYLFLPWLRSLGIPELISYLTAYIVPMALLLTAAWVALYRIEGYPVNWTSIRERFRFPRLTYKEMLWALALYAAMMIGYGIMSQIGMALVTNGVIPIPNGISPWMDPRNSIVPLADTLQGNWEIAVLWFVMLFFNIAGEELWWRGYILPRQELAHGKWTWLVHGLMWTLFHAFKWWDMIGLLPVCLIIAYSAQRMRNNWPAFIAHYIFNGMALIIILMKVLGS